MVRAGTAHRLPRLLASSRGALREEDEELREALNDVTALLEQEPENEEALQVQAQLQEAITALGEAAGYEDDEESVHDPVAAAMALLSEDDRPSDLPQHIDMEGYAPPVFPTFQGDPQAMYADRESTGDRDGTRADNNARIHPRSTYAGSKPDFAALARHYPALASYIQITEAGASLDFKDEKATRELTRSLLHNDHRIDWWVPKGHLIPPLTNRLNYIHWIEDLLELSGPQGRPTVRGLDIGCGANCIYPLLGASTCGWRFVGTDITDVAVAWARRNVACNPGLRDLIEVRQVSDTREGAEAPSGMLCNAIHDGEAFHFSMCNPPFFESLKEAGRNPNTACGGTAAEMVCKGGELAFLKAMVDESLKLRGLVHWFTSMLGKKLTMKEIRKHLHSLKVPVIRSTQFFQGETSRWAIAWSFCADPKTAAVPLKRGMVPGSAAPGPPRRFVSYTLQVKPRTGALQILDSLEQILTGKGVTCRTDKVMMKLTGSWSGQQASKRRNVSGDHAAAVMNIIGFTLMVYQESARQFKMTGSLERPAASADDSEAATRAFNELFGEAHQQLLNFCNA